MTLSTDPVLSLFEQINRIPRCSGREAAVCDWLRRRAVARGWPVAGDDAGNLVVSVPATTGCDEGATVVIQAHVDMVCEKTPDSAHDFSTDPIRCIVDGDWLRADRTTLGADNGIGVAYALAAAEGDHPHPPLELLFTVEEETGLTGARKLDPRMVTGRVLLNIDSEDEGVFIVGCAGGRDVRLTLPLETGGPANGGSLLRLSAGGMRGGHSGIDIGDRLANAVKVLTAALLAVGRASDFQLVDIRGGSEHNVIPREAEALIRCRESDTDAVSAAVEAVQRRLRGFYAGSDPDLRIAVEPPAAGSPVGQPPALTTAGTRRVVDLLNALPHGVHEMSDQFENLVETSNNLARVSRDGDRLVVLSSQRSSRKLALDTLVERVKSIAALAGGDAEAGEGYPPWEPDLDAGLLGRSRKVHERLFGSPPVVGALHAGLECAVLGAACPGIEMISLGPTMENPHSPRERLYIPSVERVWRFIVALLAEYGRGGR